MFLSVNPVFAGDGNGNTNGNTNGQMKRITAAQRKAAVKNAAALGLITGVNAATLVNTGPGGTLVPDYFGAANWAFSPPLNKFVDAMAGLGEAGAKRSRDNISRLLFPIRQLIAMLITTK